MSTDLVVKVTGHKIEIAEREREKERLCVRSTFWLTLLEVLSHNIHRHTRNVCEQKSIRISDNCFCVIFSPDIITPKR